MKLNLPSNRKITSFLFLSFLLLSFSFATAAIRTSTATGGTWSSGATWLGGVEPVAGDDVIIATTAGNSVLLGANASITNVTINSGGTLNVATFTLTATGAFVNNGTFNGSTGRLTLTGSFTNTGTFTLSGAGRLRLGGNYTNSGTVTLATSAVQFTGTANQTIQGFTTTGTVSMLKTGGTVTLSGNVTGGGLTINGAAGILNLVSGTHTFSGALTRTAGTLNCGSSLLRIGGSSGTTTATFNTNAGTVEYYGAVQTVSPAIYNNLTLSGSGAKTTTGITVNGILSMEGTATATAAPTYGTLATLKYAITTARTIGVEWVTPFAASGGVEINGAQTTTLNSAKVFNVGVPLTINSGAKLATGGFGLTFGGDFINNGGTFTAGSSPVVIANAMATQSIAGFTTTGLVSMTKTTGTAIFTGNVSGAGLTINGVGGTLNLGTGFTHTFTGNITLSNGTLNGGSSVLNVNSSTATTWTGTGTNFVAGTGTVNFGGVAQTLVATSTFNNLTFSNSGVKTLTGVPTINGILSMEGTATIPVAPNYGAAATLEYNRSVSQVAGPEWIATFIATGGVKVSNAGVVTANGNKVFSGSASLTVFSGATFDNGGFAISGSNTITVENSGTLKISGTSVFPVFATTTLGSSSTINYSGTAQTIAAKSYGYLVLSGSGNKTFVAATTITADLGISAGVVVLFPNGTSSTCGTLTLGGTLQTTLGSWGGTISTAVNKNATWFGSSTTGLINVLSACVFGTWLGLTNSDWNTPANWCGGVLPTALTDVTIGVTSNQPVVGISGMICHNIAIQTGASLTLTNAGVLSISGNWTNNGTFTPNTGAVIFNGSASQVIGGSSSTTFYNLTNSNTAFPVLAALGFTVVNTLNIANSTVLDMGIFTLTDGGSFSNNGSGQLKTASTFLTPIPFGKTWTNTILFNNTTGGQTLVSGIYNGTPSLEIDAVSGTQTASGSIVTGGVLNIDNGGNPIVDMNGFDLNSNTLSIVSPNAILDMRAGNLNFTTISSMEGTVRFSGATNGKPFATGTVEYYGANQSVANGNYYTILFNRVGGVFTLANDLNVENTLTVSNGALTVLDSKVIYSKNAVLVIAPGTLTLQNNASLVQTTYTGPNVGSIIAKRNTTTILLDDFTYWSSPTTGTQTLFDFSPNSRGDKFFVYDNDWANIVASTTVFAPGVGYVIQAPLSTSSTVPTVDTSFSFVGVPNNGTITLPVTVRTTEDNLGERLVGNPYPSSLDANSFIDANIIGSGLVNKTITGTLYFWTHNQRINGNDYESTDYVEYTKSGYVVPPAGTGNFSSPTGFIASGQGFFVEIDFPGNVTFTNDMRLNASSATNSNFYKSVGTKKTKAEGDEKHRIWLNLTNNTTNGSQMMLGYIENATNNFDPGYDSKAYDPTKFSLYSVLGVDKLSIQARALPFVDTEVIPLGYTMNTTSTAKISLDHVDGLFLDDQSIYLKDKTLNTIHDLKVADYAFASAIGTFDDRFELIFINKNLETEDFDLNGNSVLINSKNKQIKIIASAEIIDKVFVYDLLGRQIYKKTNVDNNEFLISNLNAAQQTIIVKVTLQNGKIISKKVIY